MGYDDDVPLHLALRKGSNSLFLTKAERAAKEGEPPTRDAADGAVERFERS